MTKLTSNNQLVALGVLKNAYPPTQNEKLSISGRISRRLFVVYGLLLKVAEPISVKSAVSICVNLREKGPPDASGLQEGKKGLGAIENLQDILNIWSLGVFTTKQY